MIMYVFDARWPGRKQPSPSHSAGTVLASFIVGEGERISAIVEKIRLLSQGERSIWLLRLCGHGGSGVLQMGVEGLTQQNARFLSPLAKYFSPECRGIELHACNTASAMTPLPDGRGWGAGGVGGLTGRSAFLQAIANATGVPVTGAVNVQLADDDFHWEGPGTQRVFPDKRPRLDQDLPGMSHGL